MSMKITFENNNDIIPLEKISIGDTFCTELNTYGNPTNCYIRTNESITSSHDYYVVNLQTGEAIYMNKKELVWPIDIECTAKRVEY